VSASTSATTALTLAFIESVAGPARRLLKVPASQAGEHFAEESTSARRLVNGHAEVEFPGFEVEAY
jgi:hypothetical protein